MLKLPFNLVWSSPAILGFAMLSNPGIAREIAPEVNQSISVSQTIASDRLDNVPNSIEKYMQPVPVEENSPAQVTSVSQLSDVKPTDWAFQALQSLVERYGCIAGYPDRTYRGNRALTRYEFAAGLNACLDRVNELIAASTSDLVKKEDLATLQKLQEEFAAELTTLRGRVDSLEARTTTLEKQQFSTTTKLFGEVIFSSGGVSGGNRAVSANLPIDDADNATGRIPNNIFFSNRVRLELHSSFTGRDRLLLRLQSLNTPELQDFTGSSYGRLQWDGGDNSGAGNKINITIAEYRFPIRENTTVRVAARDEMYRLIEEDVEAVSPLEGDANGSLSKFARFNPLFRLGGEYPAGFSISHSFSPVAKLSLAYLGSPASSDPTAGLGLVNGNGAYVGLAQLTLRPSNALTLGFTYAHNYVQDLRDEGRSSLDFETGSKLASNPFPSGALQGASGDSFGGELAWRLSPKFILAGWVGYTRLVSQTTRDRAELLNWSAQLVFPDLGKDGNLGAIVIGMPPKVISNTYNQATGGGKEPNSALHLEALYRYVVNDNIAITPGIIYIINPENNRANDNYWVGVVRTSFTF